MNAASARANKADGHGDNVPMTVADIDPNASAIEKAVVTGDLSCLTSRQRLEWYTSRCEAAGLDPRTQPFEYIVLKGKLKLYATKACTDQLIATHQISLRIVNRLFHSEIGLYEAQCEAKFPGGRTAEDIGVVDVYQLQGEQLANAMMKAVTKAKRRTVLSACGLGMMDETEVDTVPGAARVSVSEAHRALAMSDPSPGPPPGHGKPAADRTHDEPARPPSDAWLWMKQEMSRRWDTWAGICAIDHIDPGKKIKINHALNHLVKKWAEEGLIEEADYKDEHGKQDNDKVAAIVRDAWDRRRAGVRADFTAFLRDDIEGRAAERNIKLDDDPDGDPIDPAEPEPAGDGDTWEEGRE